MSEDGADYGPKSHRRRWAEGRVLRNAAAPVEGGKAAAQMPLDPERLIHELQVHQVELEMQNDELRRTHRELEISRSRYLELYDFAPVAYFAAGGDWRIIGANLKAAALLGVRRTDLARRPFAQFVLEEDQEVFTLHRKALLESGQPQSAELRMRRHGSVPFWAGIRTVAAKGDEGGVEYRVVASDVTERRKAGEERDRLVAELQTALEKVKQLSGFLPICMMCKKIRDDQGYWNAIELYISRYSEAEFSHGICPDCATKGTAGA